MMHDHQVLIPAAFVSRPNRFVTKAVMGDAVVTCHMPNPGRMWELLYEGTRLYLRKAMIQRVKRPMMLSGLSVTVSRFCLIHSITMMWQSTLSGTI